MVDENMKQNLQFKNTKTKKQETARNIQKFQMTTSTIQQKSNLKKKNESYN